MDSRYQVFGGGPTPAPHTVIAVGPAGFGANWWSRIAGDLTGVRVLAARLPGRETRLSEAPLPDLHGLVDDVAGWASQVVDGATAFVGVCSGCAVVTELATRLTGSSSPPALILVNPPQVPFPRNPYSTLSSAELADQLVADRTLPPQMAASPKVFGLFEATIRADFTAVETYAPAPEEVRQPRLALLAADQDADAAAGWGVPENTVVRTAVTSEDITVQPSSLAADLLACLDAARR